MIGPGTGTNFFFFHVLTNQTNSLSISASHSIVHSNHNKWHIAQYSHSTLVVFTLCLLSEVMYIDIDILVSAIFWVKWKVLIPWIIFSFQIKYTHWWKLVLSSSVVQKEDLKMVSCFSEGKANLNKEWSEEPFSWGVWESGG